MLNVLLLLGIVIFAAKASGWVSTRLGQPAVLGELLAGLLLGPTLLDIMAWPLFAEGHAHDVVKVLAEIGVILLMFIAGLEVNLADMRRAGKAAAWTGALGVAVPWIMGAAFAVMVGYPADRSLFVGIILTATSVSISAQTLIELKLLRTREGLVLLGAAVFDDVLVILALSLFLALSSGASGDPASLIWIVVRMAGFVAVAVAIGLFALQPLLRWIERLPISASVLSATVVVTFLYAWTAEALGGIAAITGAFIAGVFIGRTHARETIESGIHALTYGFFVPIFFVSIGLEVNARAMGETGPLFVAGLCVVAIVSKIVGCGLGARAGGVAWPEALRIGIGMISRGEVGLIVASIGLSSGLISDAVYAATVIMVLVTTLVTPPLLRLAFGLSARGSRGGQT
ncbi:MAG: cation:proton antiporter [Chloroflexi bacterium]|nr:cation:proton antiporter [Chloroflexota bacterium]